MKLIAQAALSTYLTSQSAKAVNFGYDDIDYEEFYNDESETLTALDWGDEEQDDSWFKENCADKKGHRKVRSCATNVKAGLVGYEHVSIQRLCPLVQQNSKFNTYSSSMAHDFTCNRMYSLAFTENNAERTKCPLSHFSEKGETVKGIPTGEFSSQQFGQSCGKVDDSNRIMGGEAIDIKNAPWNAYFHIAHRENSESTNFYCGATLIGNNHLLTAAHCCEMANDLPKSGILLGADGEGNQGHWYDIENLMIHENFNENGQYKNNLCLIKMSADYLPNEGRVAPICLPSANSCASDREPMINTGYGSTSADGSNSIDSSIQLNTLDITLKRLADCKWIYNDRGDRTWVKNSEICAGGEEGKGACDGDEGGPLYRKDANGISILYGVGSWRAPGTCGQIMIPAVYTRVSDYLEWIAAHSNIVIDVDEEKSQRCKDDETVFRSGAATINFPTPTTARPEYDSISNSTDYIRASALKDDRCAVKGFPFHQMVADTPVVVNTCPKSLIGRFRHQTNGMITTSGFADQLCWTANPNDNMRVTLQQCESSVWQKWKYNSASGHITLDRDEAQYEMFTLHYGRQPEMPLRIMRQKPKSVSFDSDKKIRYDEGMTKYFTDSPNANPFKAGFCIVVSNNLSEGKNLKAAVCDKPNNFADWDFKSDGTIRDSKTGKWCWKHEKNLRKRSATWVKLTKCAGESKVKFGTQFKWDKTTRVIQPRVRYSSSYCVMPYKNKSDRRLMMKPCGYLSRWNKD